MEVSSSSGDGGSICCDNGKEKGRQRLVRETEDETDTKELPRMARTKLGLVKMGE